MNAIAIEPIEPRMGAGGWATRRLAILVNDGPPPAVAFADAIAAIATRADREAFARLFGHFAPRVKSYMLRLGASPALAEELAQETLLTVWRKAGAFDPGKAAASTWIFRIARNLRIDGLRRERRPEPVADPSDDPDEAPTPDAAMAATQSEGRVRHALLSLPAEQAEVVRLSFYSDKAHAEIAAELGLPLGTVKSRIRLALNRLRMSLGDLA
jgi:RNA polymerase sigma-70 factor, ECF subfamily